MNPQSGLLQDSETAVIQGIRPTIIISFPRSGHHLLAQLLERIYGERMVYSGLVMRHVEWHLASATLMNVLHEHDLDLDLPKVAHNRYIVQIRHPLPALVSYYKMCLENGTETIKDSLDGWYEYAEHVITIWIGFYQKWVLADDLPNRLLVEYDQLVDYPEAVLQEIIQFMSGETLPPAEMRKILDAEGIGRLGNFRTFSYYEQKFFDYLKSRVEGLPGVDNVNETLHLH